MAQKLVTRVLENFGGINTAVTDLARPPSFMKYFTNMTLTVDKSARGRKGNSLVWRRGRSDGLVVYQYATPDDGQTVQELISLTNAPKKLQEGTLVIDGPADSTFHIYLDTNSASLTYKHWLCDLRVSGVTIGGNFPYDLGSGTSSFDATLSQLADIIHAEADWTATLTPRAVYSGTQALTAAADNVQTFNVVAGHTISVDSGIGTRLPILLNGSAVAHADVVATAATTVTISQFINYGATPQVNDGEEMGPGPLFPAASLAKDGPISEDASSGVTLTFNWYTQIWFYNTPINPYFASVGDFGHPNFHNYIAKNLNNCLYIAGQNLSVGVDTNNNSFQFGIFKYDGQNLYVAGLPQAPIPTLSSSAAAGMDDGTYKYFYRYKFKDWQGGEITGNPSNQGLEPATITVANGAANNRVAVAVKTPNAALSSELPDILDRVSRVNSGGGHTIVAGNSATYAIPVDNPPSTRIGNWATFVDRTSGEIRNYRVAAVAATSITIDFTGTVNETLSDNDYISNGLTIELFRTKADNVNFFKVAEFPIETFSYTDSTHDDDLGYEWDGPYTGRFRHDPPPLLRLLEVHEGTLVGAGNPSNPESLYWSGTHPEYWPLSTNSLDVPAGQGGEITAIASDKTSTLLCFRENEVTPIVGSFLEGNIVVSEVIEGDCGCPSPFGWTRLRDAIVFMSNKGPRVIMSGSLLEPDERVDAYFQNNFYEWDSGSDIQSADEDKFVVRRTIATHDKDNMCLLFFVPCESSTSGHYPYPNTNSRIFVFDYSSKIWTLFSSAAGAGGEALINFAGGAAFYKNKLYFASHAVSGGGVTSSLMKSLNRGDLYDYVDHVEPILNEFAPQWETVSEPSYDKDFQRIKVWSMGADPFIAFSASVETFVNFDESSARTTGTISFSSSTQVDAELQLRDTRAKAHLTKLSCNEIYKTLNISGFETQMALTYAKEDVERVKV